MAYRHIPNWPAPCASLEIVLWLNICRKNRLGLKGLESSGDRQTTLKHFPQTNYNADKVPRVFK